METDERAGLTHAVQIGNSKGYFTANYTDEGELHEVFVHGFGKFGSTMQGWTDAFCITLSLGTQTGLDLALIAKHLSLLKFEPNGETSNPQIPFCYSVPDYLVRWLVHHFGNDKLKADLKRIHEGMERR